MKKVKQLMAVFMTAIFIAGSFPVSLSAADFPDPVETTGSFNESAPQTDSEDEYGEISLDNAYGNIADEDSDTYTKSDPDTSIEPSAEAPAETTAEENDSDVEAEPASAGSQEDPAGAETDTAEITEQTPEANAPEGAGTVQTPAVNAPENEETVQTPAVNASVATYTVTLNANGGGYYIDYSNNNAHVQTVTHTGEPDGRDISVYQIPRANPGKIFAGWSTTANGKVLPTGTTVTKNLYLYAVWEQGCAVTLDANGGHFTQEDGTQTTSVMATVAKGESIFSYSFLSSGEPEADGKRLAGYGRMVNGSITLLPSTGGTGYTVTGETLTLYAVWIDVCKITYDANGGGYFTGLIDETAQSSTFTETLDAGEKVYNMNFINLVANDGCTFRGWSLKKDGSSMLSSSGYTVSAGTLTLYAVWDGAQPVDPDPDTPGGQDQDDPEVPETCTVTYDANGGNFPRAGRVRPTIKTLEKPGGSEMSLLDPENYGGTDPSKTNCTFMGWSFAADSIDLLRMEDYAQYILVKDITLYAVWTTTLTFNANGGSFRSGETITDMIFLGTTVDLGTYEIPEYPGFIFAGWAESDSSTNTVSSPYPVDAYNVNPFLYAVWEKDTARDIKGAKITLSKTTMPYTGAEQKPAVTVTYGNTDERLTEGTDYTLTYSNNVNAGTASVVVRGIKGKLTGSVTKTFTIERIAQNLSLTAASLSVTAKKTLTVTAGGARETTRYSFASSNTAIATVTSSGARGTVTGIKVGMATITVSTPQTTNYLSGSRTISIMVIPGKPGNCRFVKWQKSNYSKCLIAWNRVDGVSGYQTRYTWTDGSHEVTRSLNPDTLQQSCSVAVNHVSQFRVRAYINTAAGRKYGAWSNIVYITPSPSKLTIKKETSSGTRRVKVSWNITYGCNGYNVFVTTNPNGKWYWNQSTNVKANSTSAVITKYRGSKLKKGITYYVRIVTRRKINGVFSTVPLPSSNTYIGTFRF